MLDQTKENWTLEESTTLKRENISWSTHNEFIFLKLKLQNNLPSCITHTYFLQKRELWKGRRHKVFVEGRGKLASSRLKHGVSHSAGARIAFLTHCQYVQLKNREENLKEKKKRNFAPNGTHNYFVYCPHDLHVSTRLQQTRLSGWPLTPLHPQTILGKTVFRYRQKLKGIKYSQTCAAAK